MSENKGFTIIQNEIINSGKISLKALGLFLYLKSKPKDWRFSTYKIREEIKDGFDSIRSSLQELEDLKLIQRKKIKNEKGQFGFKFVFLDEEEIKVEEVAVVEVVEIVPEVIPDVVEVVAEIIPEPEVKPTRKTPTKKTPKPKTPPPPKLPKEEGVIYAKMVEIYFDWFKKQTGVSPKFSAIDGVSMKRIISYLKLIYKENKKEGDVEDELTGVTNVFSVIFLNWNLIDPFLQKQTKLNQIESNLQNIINDIKNGHKRKSSANDKSVDARTTRVQNSVNYVSKMLNAKKQN